jgi:hypothetical protein
MAVWCHLRGFVRKGGGGKEGGSFLEDLNFDYADYKSELEELGGMRQDDLVLRLRRGEGTRAPSSSKFRGVCWVRNHRRWQAHFKQNGKTIKLGNFVTEVGAARGYDRMMVWFKLHKMERKRGMEFNFEYAEYQGELEELGRMTQIEVTAKLRLQAQTQREAASCAKEGEAGEGAAGDAGGAGDDEGGGAGEGEGEGDDLHLGGSPAPHPNFLRWWRLGALG